MRVLPKLLVEQMSLRRLFAAALRAPEARTFGGAARLIAELTKLASAGERACSGRTPGEMGVVATRRDEATLLFTTIVGAEPQAEDAESLRAGAAGIHERSLWDHSAAGEYAVSHSRDGKTPVEIGLGRMYEFKLLPSLLHRDQALVWAVIDGR